MIEINVADVIQLFDKKEKDFTKHISSIIGVVGEDFALSLFKHFQKQQGCEVWFGEKIPTTGEQKGPRLDSWVYVKDQKGKTIVYQTEIKNWSAYAIGAKSVNVENDLLSVAKHNFDYRVRELGERKRNIANKVFYKMRPLKDFPSGASIKPLIIYWLPISQDGKHMKPFLKINVPGKGQLHIFSMSNYLRSIKEKALKLDMEDVEFRISEINKHFKLL